MNLIGRFSLRVPRVSRRKPGESSRGSKPCPKNDPRVSLRTGCPPVYRAVTTKKNTAHMYCCAQYFVASALSTALFVLSWLISLYPHVFVVCCVYESLWDVKYLDLDTKTCVPTAFCNLVLTKQHTGTVAVSLWLGGWFGFVGSVVCLVGLGGLGWRQKAPLGKTR